LYISLSIFSKNNSVSNNCDLIFSRAALNDKIESASQNKQMGVQFEANVAKQLGELVKAFRKEIFIERRIIAEIDIETEKFLIEIKSGLIKNIELKNLIKLIEDKRINPEGKQVIIFTAQPWNLDQIKAFKDNGFITFDNINSLIEYISNREKLYGLQNYSNSSQQ